MSLPTPAGLGSLWLADGATAADLRTLVERARAADPDGAIRLAAHASVLAAWVAPLGGVGTVLLGLRTLALARPSEVDVTVQLAAVADRLARLAGSVARSGPSAPPVASRPVELPLPPVRVLTASWAGVSPPRAGWRQVGNVAAEVLRSVAQEGAARVAQVGQAAGAPAVSRARAKVWDEAMTGIRSDEVAEPVDLPAGAAFVADALGFLGPSGTPGSGELPVMASGPWRRLSTGRGHVLARRRLL